MSIETYRKNFAAIDWSVPIPEAPKPPQARGPRASLSCPQIVRDSLPDLISQADGKSYDSKAALYRSYRNAGVRVMEQGEAPISQKPKPPISKAEVVAAFQKVSQGYKPKPPQPHPDLD